MPGDPSPASPNLNRVVDNFLGEGTTLSDPASDDLGNQPDSCLCQEREHESTWQKELVEEAPSTKGFCHGKKSAMRKSVYFVHSTQCNKVIFSDGQVAGSSPYTFMNQRILVGVRVDSLRYRTHPKSCKACIVIAALFIKAE